MWTAISDYVETAIDSNSQTIDALKEAHKNASEPVANLAEISLRGMLFRAHNLDTELRGFMLAIKPVVDLEKENQE